jgi:MoxR-like ATPase
MPEDSMPDWRIFRHDVHEPHDGIDRLQRHRPPWRPFKGEVSKERSYDGADERGKTFQADEEMAEMVNAALYLRRPLLVTGKPGTGKSSLIYAVAYQLRLGPVLRWPITSRSTRKQGLYEYDVLSQLYAQQLDENKGKRLDIGDYLRLGPLGTALLPTNRPRALLIDEIDKSDIDLPNDLLNIFEEGEFVIPELERLGQEEVKVRTYDSNEKVPIRQGHVRCCEFPFVVLTNNGERVFPPPFLRRCLPLTLPEPSPERLSRIVAAHLGEAVKEEANDLIQTFLERRETQTLATDQLLNAIYLVIKGKDVNEGKEIEPDHRNRLVEALLKELSFGSRG